jgi:L-histidine N-alpha-methyltransferase
MMRIEVFLDSTASAAALRNDVVVGLSSSPKTLSPSWFYDERGCELYDAITKLAEYYPFRAERSILTNHAKDIVMAASPDTFVELGSGTSEKSRLLLDALEMPTTYVPFDVAEATLRDTAVALSDEYPELEIHGIVGDFSHDLVHIPLGGRRMIALLGSTIGNLDPAGRAAMLHTLRDGMVSGDTFLLGTDLVKDRARLLAAYNDASGVTAAFNRNVLARTSTANCTRTSTSRPSRTAPCSTKSTSGSRCIWWLCATSPCASTISTSTCRSCATSRCAPRYRRSSRPTG